MKNQYKLNFELKLVAAFFLVSGAYGFFNFQFGIFQSSNIVEMIFFIIATILYALTLFSGYMIFKEKEEGLIYGRAIIAIQFINFQIAGIGYYFVTGAYIFVGFNAASNFGMHFGLDSDIVISILDESSSFVFRVNILAIAVFIFLTRLLKKVQIEAMLFEDDQDKIEKQPQPLTHETKQTVKSIIEEGKEVAPKENKES